MQNVGTMHAGLYVAKGSMQTMWEPGGHADCVGTKLMSMLTVGTIQTSS